MTFLENAINEGMNAILLPLFIMSVVYFVIHFLRVWAAWKYPEAYGRWKAAEEQEKRREEERLAEAAQVVSKGARKAQKAVELGAAIYKRWKR